MIIGPRGEKKSRNLSSIWSNEREHRICRFGSRDAIELIFAHPSGLSALTTGEERAAKLSDEIAVFPLAIPLVAGPASITAVMLLMGQGGEPLKVAVFFLTLLIALALTYFLLMLVEPLGRVLGVTGTNVIARISGIRSRRLRYSLSSMEFAIAICSDKVETSHQKARLQSTVPAIGPTLRQHYCEGGFGLG